MRTFIDAAMPNTTLTELRSNLYKQIDQLIATGVPIEIERKGHKIKISLDQNRPSKLKALKERPDVILHPDIINTPSEWHYDFS